MQGKGGKRKKRKKEITTKGIETYISAEETKLDLSYYVTIRTRTKLMSWCRILDRQT